MRSDVIRAATRGNTIVVPSGPRYGIGFARPGTTLESKGYTTCRGLVACSMYDDIALSHGPSFDYTKHQIDQLSQHGGFNADTSLIGVTIAFIGHNYNSGTVPADLRERARALGADVVDYWLVTGFTALDVTVDQTGVSIDLRRSGKSFEVIYPWAHLVNDAH